MSTFSLSHGEGWSGRSKALEESTFPLSFGEGWGGRNKVLEESNFPLSFGEGRGGVMAAAGLSALATSCNPVFSVRGGVFPCQPRHFLKNRIALQLAAASIPAAKFQFHN